MKNHYKAIAITTTLLILVLAYYNHVTNSKKNETAKVEVVDYSQLQLPTTDLVTLAGKTISTAQLRGKVLIFNFWASWCAPCIEEVPSLVSLVKADPNIIIIAVSGDENKDDILAFLKSFPDFNQPPIYVVHANAKTIMDHFKIDKLPESFIFDSNGKMVKKVTGTINWHTNDSIEYFKSLRIR